MPRIEESRIKTLNENVILVYSWSGTVGLSRQCRGRHMESAFRINEKRAFTSFTLAWRWSPKWVLCQPSILK